MKKRIKQYFKEIASIHSSPHEIALGFALGALIAILPTPGFSVLIGVLIVFLYPKTSKLALFGALAVFNPLTLIPFQVASYKLGSVLFSDEAVIKFNIVILDTVYNFSRRYLVGNLIVASATALISYPLIYAVTDYVQKSKIMKRK